MAFFPRAFCNNTSNEASFTPLFRLLEDFDKYSRSAAPSADSGRRSPQHRQQPVWQPRFDVRETADAYELYGELPGLSKDNVSIDFPEHQTIVIRGKTERNYSSTAPSAEGTSTETPSTGAATEDADQRRHSYHSATVEDESEANDKFEVVEKPVAGKSVAQTTTKHKFWLTERSIGEFSRTFQLPSRIDQEAVTASLDNGILRVLIPKAKKHEPHRVFIN